MEGVNEVEECVNQVRLFGDLLELIKNCYYVLDSRRLGVSPISCNRANFTVHAFRDLRRTGFA